MSEQIKLYKNRSIGERFSVVIDFLKQNWKVLYKNILPVGLPLAIILGYFLVQQTNAQLISNLRNFYLIYFLFIIVSYMNIVYLYSMIGSILVQYDRNQLTETTGWKDLKDNFFRFFGKTISISFIIFVPLIVIVSILAVFLTFWAAGASLTGSYLLVGVIALLIIGAFIAFMPTFTILYFPAYFSGKNILKSIKISVVLGFKNWGSLFLAIILTSIAFYIIYMIFSLPFIIVSVLSIGHVSIVMYILAILSTIGILLIYPVMILIFAFQYFSIVEKEEGVSLQSQVSEFENL